ncbi:Ankyrin repeat domain-containing protein 63 [Channa argus]|uniref:Ankyrin repeat domain-containing protein 63 n=1 Tax=Channa argus TaxID=215402 RepID=A0A6G1QK27_CHAAH|nr:Ankyrin repeat domain-containing protein 63 [Channa argus]
MLKSQGKPDEQTGTKILLEAMSKDKVHLARLVRDALDGEIMDSKTKSAETPLISSMLLPEEQTRCMFAELLLQKGASVNYQDANGRTALSYACEKGYLDAVKILVRNNADPEIEDSCGNTSLMYAAAAGHSSVVDFLVRAFKRLGLQINRQNKVGNSAVEVAKFLGHTECFFALTNTTKKGRECQAGTVLPDRGDENHTFERKVGHLVNKLEILQTCHHAACLVVQKCAWQQRPRIKQSRLPSMDSIGEFERENACFSLTPEELDFSGVLTPKPPQRAFNHFPNSRHPKEREREERLAKPDNPLPPLTLSCEGGQKSILFSLGPSRNKSTPSAHSALGILLTPILARKEESESGTEKWKMSEFGLRRFHDSYYQKRCSLPRSILSPTPPDRALVPLRKSRTVTRREESPCKADAFHVSAPASSTSTPTFSVLSNKLLRRFTSPEFKKDVKELGEDPVLSSGRIPRSETFPQDMTGKHPQVGSKPSMDSISSVKCEFDSHFKFQTLKSP